MIPFNKSFQTLQSEQYIREVLSQDMITSENRFTNSCKKWLKDTMGVPIIYMTNSCTTALEMAIAQLNLQKEDEVIIPSYTYPSTANAILLAGAKVVLCEVEATHLTLDTAQLEKHITKNTKAIIPVHYGGIACDMDSIMKIAKKYNLYVIEDVAQGFMSSYKGELLGTIGDFGCFSFHGTKDIVAGEGGALIVNNQSFYQKVSTYRMKGTNQEAFYKGQVKYYEWVSKGSNTSPSELAMALLYSQLELSDEIIRLKREKFQRYLDYFNKIDYKDIISYSSIDKNCTNNGHLFYVIFKTLSSASRFREFMKENGIITHTHFVPLHESQMGKKYIRLNNNFKIEKELGERLVRLPLYPSLRKNEQTYILQQIDIFLKIKV